MAENIDFEVRLGILKAKYKRVFRSTKVVKHPLLFPREETTVSNSQWPTVSLVLTSLGRLEIEVSMVNFSRVS